jgi:hypothetical protein
MIKPFPGICDLKTRGQEGPYLKIWLSLIQSQRNILENFFQLLSGIIHQSFHFVGHLLTKEMDKQNPRMGTLKRKV